MPGIVGTVIGGFLTGAPTGGQNDTTSINATTIVLPLIGAVLAVVGYNAIRGRARCGRSSV